ncbi:protein rolling stone-like [Tubulanus polymorphus]|uniref:protein rolling stone-like n=1 Tax=Tubulanus polymorphus TaxID=672921 RepID=UPI003DA27210
MQRTHLSLNHPEHSDFITDQWGLPTVVYIGYRFLTASFTLTWIVLSFIWIEDGWKHSERWYLYLAHWCFLMLTLTCTYHLVLVVYHKTKGGRLRNHWHYITPRQLKILWVFSNISNAGAIGVVVLYWPLTYRGGEIDPVTLVIHCFNAVYVIIDLMIIANPVRYQHAYQPMIFHTIFVIFSVIFDRFSDIPPEEKDFLYRNFTWGNQGAVAGFSLLLVLVVSPVSHLVTFAVFRIRMAIYKCSFGRESRADSDSIIIPWYLRKRRRKTTSGSSATTIKTNNNGVVQQISDDSELQTSKNSVMQNHSPNRELKSEALEIESILPEDNELNQSYGSISSVL